MAGRRCIRTLCTYVILTLIFVQTARCAELYPYGSPNGDSTLGKNNDYAASMTLERAFPFGEKYHSLVYISDNGVISFGEAVFEEEDNALYRTLPFFYDVDGDGSDDEQPDAILPFWADVDITNDNGNVYYRETTASTITSKATTDVRKYFRSNPYFTAQTVIIATWEDVSFYDQQGLVDPRNTFQAVLVTDGQESFVIYLYKQIQWVVGTRMGGDADTGRGNSGVAVVGFLWNEGNTDNELYHTESALLNLPDGSNLVTSEAGVFAYKVDGAELILPSCNSDTNAFTITPARSSMMGGERIYLLGPCWDSSVTYTCVFSYKGAEIQRVNATVVSNDDAYCVPGPFFLVGEVDLKVEASDDSLSYTATYSLIESGRMEATVTRGSPDSSIWETSDNSLSITWEAGTLDGSSLTVSVLAYREDGSAGPRWETVYEITNDTDNDGTLQFMPSAQEGVTEDNAFGVIRITANTVNRDRILWSDIHALGYLLEESYQDNTHMWASDKCSEWMVTDDSKQAFANEPPACPCTLDQAIQDVGTFITDPTCYEDGDFDTCSNNLGAKHCVLSAYASPPTQSGTKCCYDDNDLLMYAGDSRYAGMTGRSHVRGADPYLRQNLVPELSHWSNDMIAYQFCCEWGEDKDCFEYRERRPTSDCVNYEPPNIALSFGDPHFITLDYNNYTFQGLGEFTLLRYAASPYGSFDFELQGRQVRSKDINENAIDVTQLSSVAMKDADSDTIYIEASASSGMDVYRRAPDSDSWSSVYFSQQTFTDLQGCAVGVTKFVREVEVHGIVVMFKSTGIAVLVTYDYGMLGVQPIIPTTLNPDNMYGLLGNMNGDPDDDFKRRDTNAVLENPTEEDLFEFGKTWEVETDYELFYYTGNKGHSDYQNSSFTPVFDVTLTALYPECDEVSQCLYDYTVSDKNPELAMATLGTYNSFAESLDNIQKVDACPFVTTPYNGTKYYSSSTNHYMEDAEMTFECDAGLIMVGSGHRRCEYKTDTDILAWSGSEQDIACIYSDCGVLDTPQNGSISLSQDGLTATFACDEDFTREGAAESICTDGSWTSSAPSCRSGSGTNVVGIAVGVTLGVIIGILLVVLGVLYYMKYNSKKKGSKSKSRPRTTEERDAELAEPLNAPSPNPNSGAAMPSSSNEGTSRASTKIYQPTPLTQASAKPKTGGEPAKKTDPKPANAAPKDPELAEEALDLAEKTPVSPTNGAVEDSIQLNVVTEVNSAPPAPAEQKPKTPETPKKDDSKSKSKSKKTSKSDPPSAYENTPSRKTSKTQDEVEVVKGTGLLKNTNIAGSGGWI